MTKRTTRCNLESRDLASIDNIPWADVDESTTQTIEADLDAFGKLVDDGFWFHPFVYTERGWF